MSVKTSGCCVIVVEKMSGRSMAFGFTSSMTSCEALGLPRWGRRLLFQTFGSLEGAWLRGGKSGEQKGGDRGEGC